MSWWELIRFPKTLSFLLLDNSEFEAKLYSKIQIAFENMLRSNNEYLSFNFKEFLNSFNKIASILSPKTYSLLIEDFLKIPQTLVTSASMQECILGFFIIFIKKGYGLKCIDYFKQNPNYKDANNLKPFVKTLSNNGYSDEALKIITSINISKDFKNSLINQVYCTEGKVGFLRMINTKIDEQIQELEGAEFSNLKLGVELQEFKNEFMKKIGIMDQVELFFVNNFLSIHSILSPELERVLSGKSFTIDFKKGGSELKITRLLNKNIVFLNQINFNS